MDAGNPLCRDPTHSEIAGTLTRLRLRNNMIPVLDALDEIASMLAGHSRVLDPAIELLFVGVCAAIDSQLDFIDAAFNSEAHFSHLATQTEFLHTNMEG